MRLRNEQKRLALHVRNDAADALGMRRLEFMRGLDDGDEECIDQLKVSIADNVAGDPEEVAPEEIDVDQLQEILHMILEFIRQLLSIFMAFST